MKKEMTLVQEVAKKVEEAGGKMYFVGGYVRDGLLGKESKDIDVEIHGITEQQLVTILESFGQVDLVGESFGVYLIKGVDIDFAMPRHERKVGDKHTDFDVTVDPFIGTYGASKRRDFTMNAIMRDVMSGDVIDHFGGVADIQNGLIRYVDRITFQEDALRVLRAIQFSARFGFEIEDETRQVMKEMSLQALAKERIYVEIEKGMSKGYPSVFISQMQCYENIVEILPSLLDANLGSMKKGNALSYNVALMGLQMSESGFNQLVNDLIQSKQERKLAHATRLFILDILASSGEEGMALTVAKHRSFVEKHEAFIRENGENVFNVFTFSLLNEVLQNKRNASFEVNGEWLIKQGVNPSPTFKNVLDKAFALSFLGFTEEEIKSQIG